VTDKIDQPKVNCDMQVRPIVLMFVCVWEVSISYIDSIYAVRSKYSQISQQKVEKKHAFVLHAFRCACQTPNQSQNPRSKRISIASLATEWTRSNSRVLRSPWMELHAWRGRSMPATSRYVPSFVFGAIHELALYVLQTLR
jgi:hypothetical protein